MRSLSHSFLRSRTLWHFLAIAGIFTLPTPSLGSLRPSFTAFAATPSPLTHQVADQFDPFNPPTEFSIAQAESDETPDVEVNGEATESGSDPATEQATDETIDLQLGDTDPRITEVQRLLALSGYYEGEPSGIFDISTDLAVSQFQESHNLDSTGIVDSATWERLKRLKAAASSTASQTNETKAPELEKPKDTSSRPEAGSGSFSKLMLWLSLLIVAIGVVGMVFYWLLRVFEDPDPATDVGDFDELASGELAEHPFENLESGVTVSFTMPSESEIEPEKPETGSTAELKTEPETVTASQPAFSPIVDPIVAPTNVPPVTTPPSDVFESGVSEISEPKRNLEPPPPQPVRDTPIAPPPSNREVPISEVAISMASLPAPTVTTTSLSPIPSPGEVALSSDIVSAKVSITERLLQDLHHPEPSQRKKAIWELGRRGDSRAIQPLVNLMLQSDSQQRSLILAVLAEINTRSLEPMQQALALSFQDDSPEVRKNALRDLTRIFDSMSQMGYFISSSLHDRDPSVRETAQWAMTQLARIRSSAEINQIRPDNQDFPPEKR